MSASESSKWIAKRSLVDASGVETPVYLGTPEKFGPDEWRCPFRIGKKPAEVQYAHGFDAFQTLIIALGKIRVALGTLGPLTWKGGDGDPGFPQFVPDSFGVEFSQIAEKRIEEELAKFIAGMPARKKRPR
jgi:hypothetical protein